MLSKEELIKEIQNLLTLFTVVDIKRVNYKPHPYTIGSAHVVYASDHAGGLLDEDCIREAEKRGVKCAHPGCYIPYDDHTSDNILFLKLNKNVNKKEASDELLTIKCLLEENGVDGLAFIETPEMYRFNDE